MRKHVTDSPEQFMQWFPELDICPACKRGRTIFQNIRGLEIQITAEDYNGNKSTFTFKRS